MNYSTNDVPCRKQFVLWAMLLFLVFACGNHGKGENAGSTASSFFRDPVNETARWSQRVAHVTPANCEREFNALKNEVRDFDPQALPQALYRRDGARILQKVFELRVGIHERLGSLKGCTAQVRELDFALRVFEEYVAVMYYGDAQVKSETINYEKQPVPIWEASKYHPYHLNPRWGKGFQFRNGDIMLTRGLSLVSSTISTITEKPSHFSHVALVHVDEKGVATGIESYVGVGVLIYKMADSLKNYNARILVLRPKDAAFAARAADYMYKRVKAGPYIPFDYRLDFLENKKLSCEEVIYDAFRNGSGGQVLLPMVKSRVELKNADFLASIGLKRGADMLPADLEVDPRFDIVLDWTDTRTVQDTWRKDALARTMWRWMDEHDYRLQPNVISTGAGAIWSTRYIPVVWQVLSKVAGIPTDYKKDVPSRMIRTLATVKAVGKPTLKRLEAEDEAYHDRTGMWLTPARLRALADAYFEADAETYREGGKSAVHKYFRP